MISLSETKLYSLEYLLYLAEYELRYLVKEDILYAKGGNKKARLILTKYFSDFGVYTKTNRLSGNKYLNVVIYDPWLLKDTDLMCVSEKLIEY